LFTRAANKGSAPLMRAGMVAGGIPMPNVTHGKIAPLVAVGAQLDCAGGAPPETADNTGAFCPLLDTFAITH